MIAFIPERLPWEYGLAGFFVICLIVGTAIALVEEGLERRRRRQ